VTTYAWSPWDGGNLPPWIAIQGEPWFDECAAADAEQDAAAASPYAAAIAERFGLLSEWRAELFAQPSPPPPPRRPTLADNDITRVRRRRRLNDSMGTIPGTAVGRHALPSDIPARTRGRRTA